jgi:cell division transport system permease protein
VTLASDAADAPAAAAIRRPGALAPRSAAPYLVAVVSGAMCFLAVLALEAGRGAAQVAGAWSGALDGVATVRVPAPEGRAAAESAAVAALAVIAIAPGVESARVIPAGEAAALAAPWLGPDLDLAQLPAPVLIDLRLAPAGFDAAALRDRLAVAAPGATLDDHGAWRAGVERAAAAFRRLVHGSVALMALALVAMVAAAARASLAGAAPTVRTLRLVGAEDGFVAGVFDRPIALRALAGGAVGAPVAALAAAALPAFGLAAAFGAGVAAGPSLWPVVAAPLVAAAVAYAAARLSVLAILRAIEG